MTDLSHIQDDDYLVVVNAQVMIRDENKGGWVPLGRGGLSRVGLKRRLLRSSGRCSAESRHEYRIHGVLDQSEVLNCLLTKDVKYFIANPTFIHWHIDDRKFGLTFQNSRDAKAFERGVQQVVDDLVQGHPGKHANTYIQNLQLPHRYQTNMRGRYSHLNYCNPGDEEGVFMALELPIVRKGSGSTVSTTTTTTTNSPQSPALHSLPSLHDAAAFHQQFVSPSAGSVKDQGIGTQSTQPTQPLMHQQHNQQYPHLLDRDEPIMHKVIYMSRGPKTDGGTSPNNSNGSSKSQSSIISETSNGIPEQVWIHRENEANNQRARQLALVHGIAYEKSADDIDDDSSSSYVQFNHGGNVHMSLQNPPRKVPPSTFGFGGGGSLNDSTSLHGCVTNPKDHEYSYPSFPDSCSSASQKLSTSCSSSPFTHSRSPQIPTHHTHRKAPRPDSIGLKMANRPRQPSPQLELPKKSKSKRDKKASQQNRRLLGKGRRANCRYCDEIFVIDENPRGSCKDAPDTTQQCINRVSCIRCAQGLLYHCVSKEENYEDPYDCDTSDENHCKKWTILTILTLFVPCLWCYCLLRACHRCGSQCGCCGGRHKST